MVCGKGIVKIEILKEGLSWEVSQHCLSPNTGHYRLLFVDLCGFLIATLKLTLFFNLWLEDWEDLDSDEELEGEDAESVDELEEQDAEEKEAGGSAPLGAISVKDCLFCPHHSSSLMKNVAHMTKVHSFFIPDIEYLSDLKGLIQYLGKYSSFLLMRKERIIGPQVLRKP